MFTPRPYQAEAIQRGEDFFKSSLRYNAFQILPTGSGKSVVIANIIKPKGGLTVVLQPSKEILVQNFNKYTAYGYRAAIYSASLGKKFVHDVTFATIGSIAKKPHLFSKANQIIVDECHLVNPADGMYRDFIRACTKAKVLGLTATPYRLTSGVDGSKLQFINRTNPRIFDTLNYYIDTGVLFDAGHLAKLEYWDKTVVDRSKLQMNANGSDFSEHSLRQYYKEIDMVNTTIGYANRLLDKRKNLLVFCSMISEANQVAAGVKGAVVITGETEGTIRDRILNQFKAGVIKCVINVGVLTTGFDYPELEAVLIARSTMSLSLYYQIVGRAMRPHPGKVSSWIVDLGGNINFFGKIETMKVHRNDKGMYSVWNNNRQLTDITFTKN